MGLPEKLEDFLISKKKPNGKPYSQKVIREATGKKLRVRLKEGGEFWFYWYGRLPKASNASLHRLKGVVTVEQAIERGKEINEDVAKGENPFDKATRGFYCLKDCWEEVLSDIERTKKESTVKDYKDFVKNWLSPYNWLWRKKLDNLTEDDFRRLDRLMVKEGKGLPSRVKIKKVIGKMIELIPNRELRKKLKFELSEFKPQKVSEESSSPHLEVKLKGLTLEEALQQWTDSFEKLEECFPKSDSLSLKALFLLHMASARRRGQLAKTKVGWIDLKRRIIKYPPEAVKGNKEDIVYIPEALIGILETLIKGKNKEDYLFANSWKTSYNILFKIFNKCVRIPINDGKNDFAGSHDMRDIFVTLLRRKGFNDDLIFVSNGKTSAYRSGRAEYNHYSVEEILTVMKEWWSMTIDRINIDV